MCVNLSCIAESASYSPFRMSNRSSRNARGPILTRSLREGGIDCSTLWRGFLFYLPRAASSVPQIHARRLQLIGSAPPACDRSCPTAAVVMTCNRARCTDAASSSGADSNHLCRARSAFFLAPRACSRWWE